MEEAAKEWFTAGPQDKVNFNIDLVVAPGPLGTHLVPADGCSQSWCCEGHANSMLMTRTSMLATAYYALRKNFVSFKYASMH